MENNTTTWKWDHSYLQLNKQLFSEVTPTKVSNPKMVLYNSKLASSLGIQEVADSKLIQQLAGNLMNEGIHPIAQAYAGHQFGHFNILGDGRAILLGEHLTPTNERFDIQLKGPGRTPYSRNGDGRATMSAMLREYLISEAMHGFGIPTTRSLAVIGTGEEVYREYVSEGAVLTRVATSHIRVGTFQYAAKFLPKEELREFCDYVIQRHYPEVINDSNPPLAFLKKVQEKQIDLIVNWMRVGFIHGVMNTDNMSIPGETIDYGPCAFMNAYHPSTVFSSIDRNGRYAFGNQPSIAQWNSACLASALIPIIHEDKEEAVKLCQTVINEFPVIYEQRWAKMMCSKLGILEEQADDDLLIKELLTWMEENQADYTNTFLQLTKSSEDHTGIYASNDFQTWFDRWKKRVAGYLTEDVHALLKSTNPTYIPRNHLVEEALHNATHLNDFELFHQLLEIFENPYSKQIGKEQFQEGPIHGDEGYQTFCGT